MLKKCKNPPVGGFLFWGIVINNGNLRLMCIRRNHL